MDALDEALAAHASKAAAPVDPLDAALMQHAASKASPKKVEVPVARNPDPSLLDTFLNALPKGAAGFADAIPNTITNAANLGIATYGSIRGALARPSEHYIPPDLIPHDALSGWSKIGHAIGLIDDAKDPTSPAGRITDFVGQTIGGGGVNPVAVGRGLANNNAGPLVRALLASTASGVGAGAGAELTRGTKTGSESLDNLIKAGATLGGGMAGGALVASRGTAGDRVSAATKGVTPEQWAAAIKRSQIAAEQGAPITGYEALQAETGLNPKMQTQQRIAEQSDAAGGGLTQMMQQRPGANDALFNRAADAVAPSNPFPDSLAGRMQAAAEKALKAAQEARSNEAGPFYNAQRASDAEAMALAENLPSKATALTDRLQSRDRAMQTSGQLLGLQNDMTQAAKDYHPVAGMPGFPARYLPHTDVAVQAGQGAQEAYGISRQRLQEARAAQAQLDQVSDALAAKNLPEIQSKVEGLLSGLDQQIKVAGPTVEGNFLKSLRDELAPNGEPIVYPSQLESVYRNNRNKLDPSAFASSEDRTRAGVIGPQVQALNSLIQDVSPTIAQGRAAYAQASQNVVDPMKFGQVGKLARSDVFPNQAETLLPNKPMDVTPQVIERTANTINPQDPNIMRQFVAQILRGQYNEASQQNIAGPNVFGGSKFAAQAAGNPAQEANLMQALTSSGANPEQMRTALEIFRAQGMKPAVNSATTSNAAEGSALGGGGIGGYLKNPISNTMGLIDSWRNGGAASDLAKALSSGAGSVNDLAALARSNGAYNPLKQQMMANLLMADPNRQTADPYETYLKAYDAAPDAETRRALGEAYAALLARPTNPSGPAASPTGQTP